MNIINQLEQTVTPAILGANDSVAHISLLEQFYAILVARLAISEVYTQLQRTESLIEPVASSVLFEQMWQQPSQRQRLVQELAAAHHIDEVTTEQLVVNATHLAYQELKNIANGQFLPAFLQTQQSAVRPYLPVWASAVVSPVIVVVTEQPALASDALIYHNNPQPDAAVMVEHALIADGVPVIIDANDRYMPIASDAIHANPSEHYTSDTRAAVRSRNDLLVPLLLLVGALLAIGLVWALFFKDTAAQPIEPIVVAPMVTEPETVTPPQVLMPAQLMVGVDNSGNLYTCTATVGDTILQASLRQALMTSFGEQAGICEMTVQEGVATTLTHMDIETLPNILALMRNTPFSRLQLQNDSITLEAPDNILLQGLLVEVRSLVPTMMVTSVAPIAIAQPPANTYDETYHNSNDNNGNYNDNSATYDGSNNSARSNNDSAPVTSDNNIITNLSATHDYNNSGTVPENNQSAQPSGLISPADADNLANPIMADRLPSKNATN